MSKDPTKPAQETIAKPTKQDAELSDNELNSVTGGGKMDGISYLVAVTQMKASHSK